MCVWLHRFYFIENEVTQLEKTLSLPYESRWHKLHKHSATAILSSDRSAAAILSSDSSNTAVVSSTSQNTDTDLNTTEDNIETEQEGN